MVESRTAQGETPPSVSVVVPLYNEADNIELWYGPLAEALRGSGRRHEIVCVDDGSSDGTARKIAGLAADDACLKLVALRRNFGQTAAWQAGFDHSTGDVVVTMDGDGQNDPRDIGALLRKMEDGYDMVSGWRVDRKDPFLRRVLPSRVANALISRITKVPLHDYGCALKAYRGEFVRDLEMYGEMHRLVPVFVRWRGARIAEIPVRHRARSRGLSNYGLERSVKILLDLIVVRFLERFWDRPIYLFGGFGVLSLLASVLSAAYAVWLKLGEGTDFTRTPTLAIAALFLLIAVLGVMMGLLAEMIVRTYYRREGTKLYAVKDTLNLD